MQLNDDFQTDALTGAAQSEFESVINDRGVKYEEVLQRPAADGTPAAAALPGGSDDIAQRGHDTLHSEEGGDIAVHRYLQKAALSIASS